MRILCFVDDSSKSHVSHAIFGNREIDRISFGFPFCFTRFLVLLMDIFKWLKDLHELQTKWDLKSDGWELIISGLLEWHNVVVRAPLRRKKDVRVPWRRRDGGFCPLWQEKVRFDSLRFCPIPKKHQYPISLSKQSINFHFNKFTGGRFPKPILIDSFFLKLNFHSKRQSGSLYEFLNNHTKNHSKNVEWKKYFSSLKSRRVSFSINELINYSIYE